MNGGGFSVASAGPTGATTISVDAISAPAITREVCEELDDTVEATVESWVVEHARDGAPERTLASCLLADGRRVWATSDDPTTVAEMRSGAEQIGRRVKVDPAGTLLL